MERKSYNNKGSRLRPIRIPDEVDDWLQQRAHETRIKDMNSRAGVATEVNAILKEAYEAAHKTPRRKA